VPLDDVLAWLDRHVDLERRADAPSPRRVEAPTLDRIQVLVGLLGDPQHAYPVVHVTGTNGKTSASRLVASLLEARGLTVGLFTSPHLSRVNERLARNGEPISDDDLADVLGRIRAVELLMDDTPTFFEIVTAAAFDWFADVAVDVAVVEVGMGGLWDATNVADATVAVVSNVDVDHVEYLGPTREGIAREKAGIVKPGSILVLGETDPELAPVFEATPHDAVLRRGIDFGVRSTQLAHGGRVVSLYTPGGEHPDLYLPLHGAHQADNAALALAAAEAFFGGQPLDDEVVADGFATVTVPGRLEVVGRSPLVLVDGAHNPHGAAALARALDEAFVVVPDRLTGAAGGRTYVVGVLASHEPGGMLEALAVGPDDRVVACRPPSPRALDPRHVAAAARARGLPAAAIEVVPDVADAVDRAIAVAGPDGQVVITGSLYVVGAARTHLLGA
jgi:dihydrofolate synthase / folylpolyglutamate synthase